MRSKARCRDQMIILLLLLAVICQTATSHTLTRLIKYPRRPFANESITSTKIWPLTSSLSVGPSASGKTTRFVSSFDDFTTTSLMTSHLSVIPPESVAGTLTSALLPSAIDGETTWPVVSSIDSATETSTTSNTDDSDVSFGSLSLSTAITQSPSHLETSTPTATTSFITTLKRPETLTIMSGSMPDKFTSLTEDTRSTSLLATVGDVTYGTRPFDPSTTTQEIEDNMAGTASSNFGLGPTTEFSVGHPTKITSSRTVEVFSQGDTTDTPISTFLLLGASSPSLLTIPASYTAFPVPQPADATLHDSSINNINEGIPTSEETALRETATLLSTDIVVIHVAEPVPSIHKTDTTHQASRSKYATIPVTATALVEMTDLPLMEPTRFSGDSESAINISCDSGPWSSLAVATISAASCTIASLSTTLCSTLTSKATVPHATTEYQPDGSPIDQSESQSSGIDIATASSGPYDTMGDTNSTKDQTSAEKGRTAGIVVAAVSVVGACGGLSFFVARRYRRKKKRFDIDSSTAQSSSMRQSGSSATSRHVLLHEASASRKYNSASSAIHRSRNGHGKTLPTSAPFISAPVASVNSLGWL
ncbi:hypothetical protein TruAng_011878 [Truncatella angustata]|nr:hypothetical protein TruAng_011878 [Truncatella angustata]